MGASVYVGRVGALAVGLGIGAAVLVAGCPTAQAEEGRTGPASSARADAASPGPAAS